jgi:hypothetical protein
LTSVAAQRDNTSQRHADEHLRRFVAARARGDRDGMRRWWEELLVDLFDRFDGFVAASHKGRLDDAEHEEAVQRALIRFSANLIETYAGASMGELINAIRTLSAGICMDVQRRSIARRRREALALDEGWHVAGEDASAGAPAAEAAAAGERFAADERRRDLRAFFAWALPQLHESRRRVIELTHAGVPVEEIAAGLEISHANAYQLRSRGLKDLRTLKERYDA